MFLIERTISLIIYTIAMLLTYLLLGKVIKSQCKIILLFYLCILGIFAFNYEPYVTADLYRLREYIEYWIYKDWGEMFEYALNSNTPTWILYSYILSKLGNENWLQTVTCLWCFGNVFYIIEHEIERNQLKGSFRSNLLFYIMAVGAFFLQTISGIRSMLGISIIAFCLYKESVEGKNIIWHLPLWLFAALLHTSTMILVISRFFLIVIQGKGNLKKIILGSIVLMLAAISSLYLGGYIVASFEHGIGYVNNKEEYTYIWEILIGIIEVCEIAYVLRTYRNTSYNIERIIHYKYNFLYVFTSIWLIISILALPFSYTIFRRYTIFCTVMSIPLVANLFNIINSKIKTRMSNVLFIISLLIFILSLTRGDLCGYKFISN